MSEYWVSQAKYYCKICCCYISDNKVSRQHHDNGFKHKQKLEQFTKQKRLEKLHGARDEQDLKKQLAEIEKAAKEAIVGDRASSTGSFYQNVNVPVPRLPSLLSSVNQQGYSKPPMVEETDLEEDIEKDTTGIYEVRGQLYLSGSVFEEKLKSGVKCEIFIEEFDDWFVGEILSRKETPIPHTELTLKSFDVKYETKSGEKEEFGIKSDRIRLKANKEGELEKDNKSHADKIEEVNKPFNDDTGIGMWQTVSVRVYDEEQEALEVAQAKLEAETAEKEHKNKKQKIKDENEFLRLGGNDSSLAAYDPYSKNIYKGFKLDEDEDKKQKLESVAEGAIVQFKKRKKKNKE